MFWWRWEMEWAKRKGGIIKQPNEFGGLLSASRVLKGRGILWLENLLFQYCQRSFLQSSYHSMSNCSSSRNNLDFFSPHRVLRNKRHPSGLICLGRVPPGGGSAWTERALSPHWRIRGPGGGEVRKGCHSPLAISPKMLQLSLRLNRAEQQRSFSPPFIISPVFTYLCLKMEKIKVFKGLFHVEKGF